MSAHHLAQINIARFRLPPDDPANADFMNALDAVNAAAEAQDGFIWRLTGAGDNAVDIDAFDDPHVIINMSVWRDMDALAAFVYRLGAHRDVMRRRAEWFEPLAVSMALWWTPIGHQPTVEEGKARLAQLAQNGPSPGAFTFKTPFPAPGGEQPDAVLDDCA